MTKEFEKKIKEAKSEEELLKALDTVSPYELSDEDLELVSGGACPWGMAENG